MSNGKMISFMATGEHPARIKRLAVALARPLPGLSVQMGMAPMPRPGTERILDPFLDCRRAAVLVLFYPSTRGDLRIVLTRRTDRLESHSGQISFPGGSMDPGEDPHATAKREALEELGVKPGSFEVIGELSPLYIPPSGFCVYPVVGYAPRAPTFAPNAEEVAEVLEAPVDHLLKPATRCEETWDLRGAPVLVPYYAVGPHKVWGATAMMLCELLALLGDEAM
jgi:8-oxo-dGTP pyrophosphatase MutT (NUDIX family)